MRINNNIMAMNANRQLAINNTNTQKSLEKLSSGLRINRAGDDIGGLNKTHAILQRMRSSTSAENLQAAESRIRDVDMAKEMMEFTKQTILQQAATAMLAQANQMPQTVLQLLR